ncbi:MAG: hypothetical protein B6241_05815 [Spirochaetaceae bacterium 4572_59]|nr:MAG: hypothetical protein B6241_05815 [Spirochaetaceae bacterium 4572_59]
MSRDREPMRLVFVHSLREVNPEVFLMNSLKYRGTGIIRQQDKTIFFEKRDSGKVPVLCFHRIGDDPKYELSVNRTHHLMAYLAQNRYYPLSDEDFAKGNFSLVPSGLKPFVIGADDGTRGQIIWSDKTLDEIAQGYEHINPELDPNCLGAIFSRYFPAVNGHYNLTFYVSFDAVPFRQTGGIAHSGFPYRDLPVVGEKFRYVEQNFYLGHHTVTHTYLGDQTPEILVEEIQEAEVIFSNYLHHSLNLRTMAYPYGLAELKPGAEQVFQSASEKGIFPDFAYDLDGELSVLPWNRRFQPFRISRVSVQNRSFDDLLKLLKRREVYTSRRTILLYSRTKNMNIDSYNLTIGGDDIVYVYIP